MSDGRSIDAEDLGVCPFCGGRIAAIRSDGGEREYDGVLHSEPACETFERLDALPFMIAAHKEAERLRAPPSAGH